MTTKLYCPHCGRCIAITTSSDEKGITKVLIEKPLKLKKKQVIQGIKCIKCKAIDYVSMEFID